MTKTDNDTILPLKRSPTKVTEEPKAKKAKVGLETKAEVPVAAAAASPAASSSAAAAAAPAVDDADIPIWEKPMARVEPVPKKKRRGPQVVPIPLRELKFGENFFIQNKKKNSHGGYLCGISNNATKSHRVYTLVQEGVMDYKFGISYSENYDKWYAQMNFSDETLEALQLEFESAFYNDMAARNLVKGASTPEMVAVTGSGVTIKGSLRDEDDESKGRYNRKFKVAMPKQGDRFTCKITDEDDNEITENDFDSVNGRKVISAVVMVKFLWFRGKNEFGVTSELIRLVVGESAGPGADDFDEFLKPIE